ncbi:MAG: DUF3857 domain-containing protein [Balneolaceae bacterium]|nr:DUF3857 domain-containing protein [Balneolaceae bacterium]
MLILFLCLSMEVKAQFDREILDEVRVFNRFGDISESDFEADGGHGYPYEYLKKESLIRVQERDRGIVAMVDNLIRIKVHTDDPLEKAEASMVGIPYYFADDVERIVNFEAVTHHPDGTQSRLERGTTATVDLNTRYRILEFEMPDVEQGSIIEYKYTLERRYIEELPDFYFAHRVPTREATLYVQNADFVRYDVVEQNVNFDVQYEEHRVDTSSIPLVFTYQRPDPVFVQKWSAEDIPAVDAATYISSIDDIRAKMKFQISEFGMPRQSLENSWDYVAAQIYRNYNPYSLIDEFDDLKNAGRDIAANEETEEEAMNAIFRLLNGTVQFNEQPGVFPERSLEHVIEGEPSDQAEINLTLLAMLRGAGIEAKPLYISNRDFGRINKSFPSLFQFNSLLVVSEIEGDTYFMDASYPNSVPNLIPVEAYNEQGMALGEDGYEWIDISPERSIFKLDIALDAVLTHNGNLRGTLFAQTRGYPAQQIRQNLERGTPLRDIIRETFFDVYDDIELSGNEIRVDDRDLDDVRVSTTFEIPNYAVTFTEGIEFRPMVVGYLFRNPFESDERRAPITLDAPELISINYNIELPDGFSVDVSGDTNTTSLRGASLFEEYLTEQNRIEYTFEVDISRKEFPADDYNQLRQLYQRWVSLSNDTWYIEGQRL